MFMVTRRPVLVVCEFQDRNQNNKSGQITTRLDVAGYNLNAHLFYFYSSTKQKPTVLVLLYLNDH
jgi:hypothetical protein